MLSNGIGERYEVQWDLSAWKIYLGDGWPPLLYHIVFFSPSFGLEVVGVRRVPEFDSLEIGWKLAVVVTCGDSCSNMRGFLLRDYFQRKTVKKGACVDNSKTSMAE